MQNGKLIALFAVIVSINACIIGGKTMPFQSISEGIPGPPGPAGPGTFTQETSIVSVLDYDAKGDGVTGDRDAIYNAIDDASNRELLFPAGTYRVESELTFGSTVAVRFLNGAKLSIDSGVTVTINCPLEAGLYQIFSGDGYAHFGNGTSVEVYPEWWGKDTPDCIQKALDSFIGGTVRLSNRAYTIEDSIVLTSSKNIVGAGRNISMIRMANGKNTDVIKTTSLITRISLRHFGIDGNKENNTSGSGINIDVAVGMLDNLWIYDCPQYGMIISGGDITVLNCAVNYCNTGAEVSACGVHIGGGNYERNTELDLRLNGATASSINGAYFENYGPSSATGVELDNCSSISIQGCYLNDYSLAIRLTGGSHHNIIGGNRFNGLASTITLDSTTYDNIIYPNDLYTSVRGIVDYGRNYRFDLLTSKFEDIGLSMPALTRTYPDNSELLYAYPYAERGSSIVGSNASVYVYSYGRDRFVPDTHGLSMVRVYNTDATGYAYIDLDNFETDRDIVALAKAKPNYHEDGNSVWLQFERDGAVKNISQKPVNIYNWHSLELPCYIPVGTDTVRLRLYGDGESRVAYFNEIFIVPSEVKNGDFEEGWTNGLADSWSVSAGAIAAQETTNIWNDTSSQKISADNGEYLYQALSLVVGAKYRLRAKILLTSGSMKVGIGDLAIYDGAHVAPPPAQGNTWSDIDMTFRFDAGIANQLRFMATANGTIFCVDCVYIYQVNEGHSLPEITLTDRIIEKYMIFDSNDATPSVKIGNVFKTTNTSPTTITMFDDGVAGQTIRVIFGDDNTIVDFTGTNLRGNGGIDWSPKHGDHMTCVFDGTDWYCDISNNTP
jgi:hypothetical protein